MTRRWLSFFALSCMVVFLAGCQQNQQIKAELISIQNANRAQRDLLKKQNELLNRKLNDMIVQVDDLQETNDKLSAELSTYRARPEEVKLEIISEVNTRFGAIAAAQEEFKADVNKRFDQETTALEDSLKTDIEDMQKALVQHATFVRFVATEQDSINRVFANRFDSRPWYQSVIGKWEDMERAKQVTP